MATYDPRIDAYIAKAAPFAQPILARLRELVHEALPDVEEDMKWGSPHFLHHGMLAGMAAFKQHAAFGFWKGKLVTGDPASRDAMGQFGRIASLADLPPTKQILAWVQRAAALNASGAKAPRPLKHPRKAAPAMPAELAAALARNAKARKTFDAFSPSHRREYIEWIVEAKADATRAKRLATTIEQLAAGKALHWKYQPAPRKAATRPARKAVGRSEPKAKSGKPATTELPARKRIAASKRPQRRG